MDYTNSQQIENEETGDDEIPRRDDVYNHDNTRDNIHEATENTKSSLTNFLHIRTLTPKESIEFSRPIRIFRRRSDLRRDSSKKRRPNVGVNSEERKRVCDGRHEWRDKNNQFSDNNRSEIARILIPKDGFDSARHSAQCLVEASATDVFGTKSCLSHEEDIGWDSATEDDDCNEGSIDRDGRNLGNIAGVFRERDRAYIPISAIHLNPTNFTGDKLCLQRPLPTTLQRPTRSTLKYASIFQSFIEVLGVVIFSKISYHAYKSLKRVDLDYLLEKTIEKSQQILESAIAVPYHLSNVFVEFPLKELYRHGPSFLGLEGDSLPRICARITYHGDPEFWSLNMDECQRVYDSKEAAALHVWKPILMLIWAIGVFYMVTSIFATWALRRRERLDPDIVETYQAIRMLFRQFRRAMDTP